MSMFIKNPKKNSAQPMKKKPDKPVTRPFSNSVNITTGVVDDLDDESTPEGKFRDIPIYYSSIPGQRVDIMQFADAAKEVELEKWRQPIKLNRQEMTYRPSTQTSAITRSVDVKLGDERRVTGGSGGGVGNIHGPSGGNEVAKPEKKQRFTRVTYVPEDVRKLREEERLPWVIEEASSTVKPAPSDEFEAVPVPVPGQVWVGTVVEPEKNQTHAILVPTYNGSEISEFRFRNLHRFYRFTKRRTDAPRGDMTLAEHAKFEKSRDSAKFWLSRKSTLPKATETLRRGVRSQSGSLDNVEGDENDGDNNDGDTEAKARRLRKKKWEEDGHPDEMYEEEFSDDEETIFLKENDEEMFPNGKQMEDLIRREDRMRYAGFGKEDDDSDNNEDLGSTGKELKKLLLKNGEENKLFRSNDDEDEKRDPYASGMEEEEEPPTIVVGELAVIDQRKQGVGAKEAGATKEQTALTTRFSTLSLKSSVSLTTRFATLSLKRKGREDDDITPDLKNATSTTPSNSGHPQRKKAKLVLEESMIINFLRERTGVTTRDCVQKFQSYVHDEESRGAFTAMVKKVAISTNGGLVLRE